MQDDDDFSDEDTLPGTPVRRRTRVLVVDDDWAMRELVATRLEEEGYDVREAESGRDLLATLEKITADAWPFDGVDLILLDMRMPGMTGLDAVRKLRAAHWDTPTILMTAFPDAAVKKEALALGVPVLAKPFPLDELSRTALLVLFARGNPPPPPCTFHRPS